MADHFFLAVSATAPGLGGVGATMAKEKITRVARAGWAAVLGAALCAAPFGISHPDHGVAFQSAAAKGGDHGGGSDGDHGGGNGKDNAGGKGNAAGGNSAGAQGKVHGKALGLNKATTPTEEAPGKAKAKNTLGALNAAHANPNAFANAAPNSRVGKIAAYMAAVEASATAEQAVADAKTALDQALADVAAAQAALSSGTVDRATAQANLDTANAALEAAQAGYDAAVEAAETTAADEQAAIEAASNRETVTAEMVDAVRDLLGL